MEFEVGQVYNRKRDIHDRYGGQRQGGMSTPSAHAVVFLFTGQSGAEHGYQDEFKPDGTYHYTGEGQRGDMAFVRSNRALRDHLADGKRVHVFEALGDGNLRYVGEAAYLGHHVEESPDTDGNTRQAIVFELDLETESSEEDSAVREPDAIYSARSLRSKPLNELHRLVFSGASRNAPVKERR